MCAQPRAVVASANADICFYLQPDTIVLLDSSRGDDEAHPAPRVLRNLNACSTPRIRIHYQRHEMDKSRTDTVDSESKAPNPKAPRGKKKQKLESESVTPESCFMHDPLAEDPQTRPPTASLWEWRHQYSCLMSCPGQIVRRFGGLEVLRSLQHELPAEFKWQPEHEASRTGRIVLWSTVQLDAHTSACDRYFDTTFDGRSIYPLPSCPNKDVFGAFRVGMFTGPSGSAKSLLLRRIFGCPTRVIWNNLFRVFDHFPNPEIARQRLAAVGLDAEVVGRRLPNALSAGQRHLCDCARLLGRRNVIIDEFASCLDRTSARILARAIQSYPLEAGEGFGWVVASCYSDIVGLGLLEPDWVFDTASHECLWLRQASLENEAAAPTNSDLALAQSIVHTESVVELLPHNANFPRACRDQAGRERVGFWPELQSQVMPGHVSMLTVSCPGGQYIDPAT